MKTQFRSGATARASSALRQFPLGIQRRLAGTVGEGFLMPRMDRLATLYLSFPLKRLFRPKNEGRVPILMYHSVSENLFGKSHPYYQINTSPRIFARQMRWLHEAGYRTLSLSQLRAVLETENIPARTVAITFDDGFQDFYIEAFPVLRRYGFTATVFPVTNWIHDTPARMEGVDFMTWQEVRELHGQGIEFGSHTVSHADLRSLGPEEIDYEVGYSKETIEDHIGVPVRSFAYPLAFPEEDRSFSRFREDLLKSNGFESGVSTIVGRAATDDNRFFLPRLPVNSWDDYALFRAKLEGGYDWVHWPQWLHKFAHHNVSLMQRSPWVDSEEAQ